MLAHLDAVTGTAYWQHVRHGKGGGPGNDGASAGPGAGGCGRPRRGRASVGVMPELAHPQGLSLRAYPEGLLRHGVDIWAAHPGSLLRRGCALAMLKAAAGFPHMPPLRADRLSAMKR